MTREAEKALLKDIAGRIGNQSANLPKEPLTGFLAMVGRTYKQELMVIGRAVNGWTKPSLPSELTDEQNISQFVERVFESVTGGDSCPMKWVSDCWGTQGNDYNTKTSAFWRCIRSTVGALNISNIETPEWPSHLVWSNLYKVAPGHGGNPSSSLCSIQFDGCAALLKEELRSLVPRRILFMTGLDWAKPFLEKCSIVSSPVPSAKYVQGISTIKLNSGFESRVVVAVHPQGKPESVWVEEVVNEFKKR